MLTSVSTKRDKEFKRFKKFKVFKKFKEFKKFKVNQEDNNESINKDGL